MRQTTISKEFRFEASHQLLNHDGKCRKPHGHSYRVKIEVEGNVREEDGSPEEGMVIDFARITEAWKKIEPALDHCDLNSTIAVECGVTTAENIASWILDRMSMACAVELYETATSCVRVER